MSTEKCPPPPTKVEECWDWINSEEVVGHALAAFSWASQSLRPPDGEPFLDAAGHAYADRQSFADCISHFFDLRIKAAANELGIGQYSSEAQMLQHCEKSRSERTT